MTLDLQDRIMVSLTSLLVLVTFFTDTSQKIPRTSYLKLIDIWFVSLMFEDFLIILSIVYVEDLHRNTVHGNFIRVLPADGSAEKPHPATSSMPSAYVKKLNKHLRSLFTFSLFLILAVFIPVGIYSLTYETHEAYMSESYE